MTLRTPRRRVSPRARKRYRAIKGFFRRAIGGSSQPDIVINSSTVNVTDLKHKIVGLEQQLSEVSRTCREFIYLDGSRGSQSTIPTELKDDIQRDDSAGREPQIVETKVLYKPSQNHYRNFEESDYTPNYNQESNYGVQNDKMNEYVSNNSKSKKKKSKVETRAKNCEMMSNLRKLKTQSASECVGSAYSTSSFHSLHQLREVHHSHPGYSGDRTDRKLHKIERNVHDHSREEIHKEQTKRAVPRTYDDHREDRTAKHSKNRKSKHKGNELDQDFIADIIKRQYRPVQLFGRKESDMSQISEPLCRDREFVFHDNIQEDTELCSCCYGGRHSPKHHRRYSDNSDTRSVCDARLYSSKRNPRLNKYRRVHADAYDSELYDLIPVKEKSSPKSRRKFARDNLENYRDYKEVLPSPRTHRPRLNLKAQYYTESEDHEDFIRYQRDIPRRVSSPKRHSKYERPMESFENDYSLQMLNAKKNRQRHKLHSKPEQIHQDMGTMSSLQYPQHYDIDQNNVTVDTPLNNTQESGSSDKTDRALFEIKDILQSFLQEIKKETSSSDKSDVSTKVTQNCVSNPNPQVNGSVMPTSGHSSNYNAPHCSSVTPYFMPPYPNTCCYPVMPMYSMNCMQNGFAMPSQSFTCGCSKADEITDKNKTNNTAGNETYATETDELIKEIYKFVAQSPTFGRKQDGNVNNDTPDNRTRDSFENRLYTTRSAGDNTKISKHDVKVGTPEMKCYSKSCEAIGSRMLNNAYYSDTNPTTYSDSTMENISLAATATTSVLTELSTDRIEKYKQSAPSNTKFGKVLRSFGLFKKKKDIIEEESESESTIEVEINKSNKPPFRQEVTNYMVSDQVYDRPPPAPQGYQQPHYPYDYRPPFNPATHYSSSLQNDPYYDPRMHQQEPLKGGGPQYHPGYPSAPQYPNCEHFNQMQPQVPLCLKEIEVKSMATQSERKLSFFRKIKQKMQPINEQIVNDGARNFATQTKADKPSLWKNLQEKALEGKKDQMTFSFQQQQKLASKDNKMRNVMLKKMFYKRNPFSPRNLIVRTLLGKDKASFGEPPAMYRPSMFI